MEFRGLKALSSVAMELAIVEIHPADSAKLLNTEWFVLENQGSKPFHTKNCTVSISRAGQKKRRDIGTMEPGVVLPAGEKLRIITGNPGRKAQGKAPVDDTTNYHLFLGSSILQGDGCKLTLSLRAMQLTHATFAKDSPNCVAPPAAVS